MPSALSEKSPCLFADTFSPAFSSELSGFHSKFHQHPPSRFEVQELESWETGKVGIEGDEAAATGESEGG